MTNVPQNLEIYYNEEAYNFYINQLSNIEFQNTDLQYILEHKNEDNLYSQYVEILLQRNGIVSENYIIFDETGLKAYQNSKISKAGYEVHHIKENVIGNLSHEEFWYLFPEFQVAETLVYATNIEHVILHYLIAKEDRWHTLGQGGLFNHHMLKSLQITKSLSDSDYLGFCYLIGAIDPRIADKVDKVLHNRFTPQILENKLFKLKNFKYYLMTNHPYGITTMTLDKYEELYHNGEPYKRLRKYTTNEIFVLRSNNNHFMLMAKKKNENSYYLLNGGAVSILCHAPEWYLPKIDKYQLLCSTEGDKYLTSIRPIADAIKAAAGSGHIHGGIIDIDYFHHIKVDLENKMFIPYSATGTGWRTIFPSVNYLVNNMIAQVPQKQLENTAIIPLNTQSIITYEQNTGFNGLITPIVEQPIIHTEKGFYKNHYNISRIIDTGITDIIYKWFEAFEDDEYWNDYYSNFIQEPLELKE